MNRTIIFTVTLTFFLASCGTVDAPNTTPGELIVCTQDAMQCPDGTWVGRSGPKCEFVCPQSKPK